MRRYKLKYSSLISLKKKKIRNNSVLYLKGPLGINYLKVPFYTNVVIDNKNKVIIFSLKNKKKNLIGFLSRFENSCRILVFGDLVGLNIKGLGLKFLNIKHSSGILSMNLGFSDTYHHAYDTNHFTFFQKDIRNIYIYSTNYEYLRGETYFIITLKKPNRFQKRENGITITSTII